MQLSTACIAILDQLSDVVRQIDQQDYSRPSPSLGQSTVGQHLRHTLEFFLCLESGFEAGIVNYDKRSHDKLMESDKFIALSTLGRVADFISTHQKDQLLLLEVGYESNDERVVTIQTNYYRELTYNIEHAVHHMAIMKIGLREVAPGVRIPAEFGIAASTIRYREEMSVVR